MLLVAAGAVVGARAVALVAVLVAGQASSVVVAVVMWRALRLAAAVLVGPLAPPAADAGEVVRGGAAQARGVALWKEWKTNAESLKRRVLSFRVEAFIFTFRAVRCFFHRDAFVQSDVTISTFVE